VTGDRTETGQREDRKRESDTISEFELRIADWKQTAESKKQRGKSNEQRARNLERRTKSHKKTEGLFPALGDLVNTVANVGAGFAAIQATSQHLVVVGFAMADVRGEFRIADFRLRIAELSSGGVTRHMATRRWRDAEIHCQLSEVRPRSLKLSGTHALAQ